MRLLRKWTNSDRSYLSTYVELLPLPAFVVIDDFITDINEEALELFGADSIDQLRSKSFPDFFIGRSRQILKENLLNPVQLNLRRYTIIASMQDLRGEMQTVEMRANNILIEGRQGFLIIAQNKTRQHQIEQELIDNKYLIEKIAQTIPDIIYVTDILTNESIFENQSLLDFLGFREEDITTNKWTFLFSRVHPEDIKGIKESARNLQISANDKQFVETEYRLLDAQNNWRWIYSRSRVFKRSEDGKPLQHFGIAHDITDLKNTQQRLDEKVHELKAKNEELEKYITSNRELEKYAYIASHDLKEPLRTIIGFSQLLEKKYSSCMDVEAHDYINHIVEGTKRMEILVKGLLSYSRVESEGLPFEFVNLNELMQQILRDLKNSLEDDEIIVSYSGLPTIHCDKLQFRQLFQNLISNSIKFKRNVPLNISIGHEKKAGEYLFHVKDNGIGIDMSYKEKIFDIFNRLHTNDKYPGAGIGLSICKRIVERHNGKIWLESKPGEGTIFYVSVPY